MSLMLREAAAHDCAAGEPDQDTGPPMLADALGRLRLRGAIFLRGEYTESWSYESLPGKDAASLLHPGTQRVILFHVVARGNCWIEAAGERLWAEGGDVLVLPYGDLHRVGGSAPAVPVAMAALPA